jgi:putative lipase involved disintegration of autophagic bodies
MKFWCHSGKNNKTLELYNKSNRIIVIWTSTRVYKYVWQCGCGCFSNSFLCQNTCQWCFFLKKIIFDISTSKWFENTKNILI